MPKKIPSYRLHKPSGQAVVTLGGKDFYLGPWRSDASKREYDRLTGEWMANGRRLVIAEQPAELTMVELLAAYLEFAKGYYVKDGQPTVHLGIVKRTLARVRQNYAHTLAKDFGPLALKAIQQKMVEDKLSRLYMNAHCARIKRMFKWAVSEELIDETIYRALATVPGLKKGRTTAVDHEPVGPVPDKDVDATLPKLPAVVRSMAEFQRLTGCRPSEACILRPMDIDRSGNVWRYTPASHKTAHLGKQRCIFIGPRAQAVLLPWLLRPADAFCFCPKESARVEYNGKPVAKTQRQNARRPRPSRRGTRYTKDSYRRAVARACDRANITPWSPNQLRHSRATEIRKAFGLEAAQLVLGHAKADVTQIYAEANFEKAQRIMGEVG